MKLSNTKQIVREILEVSPKSRDDDTILMYWVYKRLMPGFDSMLAKDFLQSIYKNDVPKIESIRRCRQKWQEECEELRGKVYYERHKLTESIKEELKQWEV